MRFRRNLVLCLSLVLLSTPLAATKRKPAHRVARAACKTRTARAGTGRAALPSAAVRPIMDASTVGLENVKALMPFFEQL